MQGGKVPGDCDIITEQFKTGGKVMVVACKQFQRLYDNLVSFASTRTEGLLFIFKMEKGTIRTNFSCCIFLLSVLGKMQICIQLVKLQSSE